MLNEQMLIAILRQIVLDMAYAPGLQINTFGVITNPPNLYADSFEFDYQAYEDGTFWSRSWVYAGAKRDTMCAEFPALFIEQRSARLESVTDSEMTFPFSLLVIDKIECGSCPDKEFRTPQRVKANVLTMLRSYIAELATYELWQLERDGDTSFEWLSAGRLARYKNDETITLIDSKMSLMPYVGIEPIELIEWGNYAEFMAYYTSLNFLLCIPTNGTFNYSNPIVPQLAIPICPTC